MRLALLVAGIVVVGLVVFGLTRQNQRYAVESEAHLLELKKRGKPLTIAEVAKAYDAEFAQSNSGGDYFEIFELLPANFEQHIPKRRLFSQELGGRIPGRNLDDDSESFALDERLTPAARSMLADFVTANEPLFSRADQLTNKASVRFQYNWSEGTEMRLPRLTQIKTLARLIEARCQLHIDDGNAERAIEDIKLLFRISSALEGEVVVIAQLVRAQIRRFGMRCLNRLLCQIQLSPSELMELQNCLSGPSPRELFVRALEAERAFFLDHFQNQLVPQSGSPDSSSWHYDRWVYLTTFQKFVDVLLGPEGEIINRLAAVERDLDLELKIPKWRWHMQKLFRMEGKRGIVSGAILPAFFGVGDKALTSVAEERLAKLAIAIELYRLENGTHPITLSALDETALSSDAMDPFTGKKMLFQSSPDRSEWILYSLGKNQTDEGGEGIRRRKAAQRSEGNWEPGRDIVFPLSAKHRR